MCEKEIRPWNLLPVPHPRDFDPSEEEPDYFYKNFIKPMIPDMIDMTTTGLTIDQDAVEDLRSVIDKVLKSVDERLAANPLVLQYQEQQHPALVAAHKAAALASVRDYTYYLKEYDNKNMSHRTFAVNAYLRANGKDDKVKPKWTIAEVKKLNIFIKARFLDLVITSTVPADNKFAIEGARELAEEKSRLWNIPRIDKSKKEVVVPPMNPGSSKQLQEFFKMLGIPAITTSKKTSEASWNRDNIQILQKMNEGNEELTEVLDAIVDHSFSGIIKNNFLAAFDSFTIDGVLYGNIKLFGAKSFRPTSNSPNLNDFKRKTTKTSLDDNKQMIEWCFLSPILLTL